MSIKKMRYRKVNIFKDILKFNSNQTFFDLQKFNISLCTNVAWFLKNSFILGGLDTLKK